MRELKPLASATEEGIVNKSRFELAEILADAFENGCIESGCGSGRNETPDGSFR